MIRKSGAKYVVLTTKHHDGFCLYPSEYTDFNCEELGPKRDITGELTDAVRSEGLKMGLYYSGLIDWQFANDPIFKEEDNFGNACPTFEYADYSYNQMKELVDKYHPSVFWNDIGWPKQSEHMIPRVMILYPILHPFVSLRTMIKLKNAERETISATDIKVINTLFPRERIKSFSRTVM